MKKERFPELDGLRAFAVLLVIWGHTANIDIGLGGYHGVLLFFVISGFLITGILLGVRGRASGRTILRAFYARRFLRIFPVYYVVLLLTFIIGIPGVRESIGWHLAYLSNWFFILRQGWGGPASHLWSLSVEEQFYLLWPCFALLLPRRVLPWAIGLMILSGPVSRFLITIAGINQVAVWVATPTVLDALGLGCLLAYFCHIDDQRDGVRAERVARYSLIAGLLLTGLELIGRQVGFAPALRFALDRFGWRFICLWIVYRASAGSGLGIVGRSLAARPTVYIGTISYGIYLIHNFVLPTFWMMERRWNLYLPVPHRPGIRSFVAEAVFTIAGASLSWILLERPLNNLKTRFPYIPKMAGEPGEIIAPAASGTGISPALDTPKGTYLSRR